MITNRIVGGSLIVAGTCIGAGMLALPVSTAPTGFFLSLFILTCAWFFMYLTGLYVLEVNLRLPAGNNYVSMAQASLGKNAAFVTWLAFICLLYSLLAAYVTSGGELTEQLLEGLFGVDVPRFLGPLVWTLAFSILIYFGVKPADYLNRLFMTGLILTYGFVIILGSRHINSDYYQVGNGWALFAAFPVIFTSFGYQIVVPSMSEYLKSDSKKIRRVILFGSLIPLVVYCLWEALIFGTIPSEGGQSLQSILQSGQTTKALIQVLQYVYGSSLISMVIRCFIFFAIASSFLGVSLGLFDFIADSLHVSRMNNSRLMLIIFTFLPPLIYAELYPHGFLVALNYAGLFVAFLHGILPVMMVYAMRARGNPQIVWGGTPLLALTLGFFIIIIGFDIGTMFGYLPGLH